MNRIVLSITGLAFAFSMTLLAGSPKPATAQEVPVPVVATFSILADLVEQVGGDHVDVTTLVTPNLDAHTFEPAPDQVVGLTNASVIFEIGIGFEPWLDGMVDAARPDAARVVVSNGVTVRSAENDHVHDEEAEHEEDEHNHGADDPHIWHNPLNAVIVVENIAAALVTVDPAHQSDYEANAAAYIEELTALDAWIEEQVEMISVRPAEAGHLP